MSVSPGSERRSGVSAVLLAAGSGSRFGGGKLLASYRGRPLIEYALAALRDSPVDEIILVVGDDRNARELRELREVCEPYESCGLRVVGNPEWAEGQSTSVRAGMRALGAECRAMVVALADQPLIGGEVVRRLVVAFEEGAKIAVATYGGKGRNPVLFAREVWTLLEEGLSGDEGARRLIRAHPELVERVPCDDAGDPADVDTREDLRRLEESD